MKLPAALDRLFVYRQAYWRFSRAEVVLVAQLLRRTLSEWLKLMAFLACALALALCAGCTANTAENVGGGNMPDLGYPEPYWYPISQGDAADPVFKAKKAIQLWGAITPGSKKASICKWEAPAAGDPAGSRGTCKTDISWITASAGFKKSAFNDPVLNYILRFQLYGACYRSTQVWNTLHSSFVDSFFRLVWGA